MKETEMLLHANHLEFLNKNLHLAPVKIIIHYLRIGDFEAAKQVYYRDLFLIEKYPTIAQELAEIFGHRSGELQAKKTIRRNKK